MGRALRQSIGDELQRWSEPNADALAHRRTELSLGRLKSRRRLGAFGLAAEHGVEHRRILQIAGHSDIGDRDEAQSLVLDAVLQRLGHENLDAVCNLPRTGRISHGPYSPRKNSYKMTGCEMTCVGARARIRCRLKAPCGEQSRGERAS